MHARSVTIESRPENLSTAIQRYQDKIIPAAAAQRGFRGGLLLTDSDAGTGTSITFWETKEDLLASEQNGFFQQALATLSDITVGKPVRRVFEVSVNTVFPAGVPTPGMADRAPATGAKR